MSGTRLLSIHPDSGTAGRSADTCGVVGARVERDVKGTTPERPWGVVVDRKGRGEL
jgi:hypothetical protein